MASSMGNLSRSLWILLLVLGQLTIANGTPKFNYKDALAKSILFFQGQRSGKLPSDQGIAGDPIPAFVMVLLLVYVKLLTPTHASHSVDLTGGYYDAGDNVKFNFPMAFSTTMLSWGVLGFGGNMGPHLNATRAAIRWATNYLYKCAIATPGKLYIGVGDPNADHECWERPEDMDTPRTVYSVSPANPGSDVAAETAAALASAALVFRSSDRRYSALLLTVAKKVMQFAIEHRGAYSDSLGSAVCPFYCSYSGYKDELLWGAAWLYRATKQAYYSNLLNSLGASDATDIFSWDNKVAGAWVLLSREAVLAKDKNFEPFKQAAEDFICRILPHTASNSTQYTQGGLMFKLSTNNLQYVTSITFLLTTYSKYMKISQHTITCGSVVVTATTLRRLAKRQVDYILGDNPLKMSYMVGFGENYPKRIHHRASSLPAVASHPQAIKCSEGFDPYYHTSNPNPNLFIGAIVGGPNQNDAYTDDRTDYSHSEPATYINAAIVGPLASFASY